jgi:plasmid maintenance system antidote protein VapI
MNRIAEHRRFPPGRFEVMRRPPVHPGQFLATVLLPNYNLTLSELVARVKTPEAIIVHLVEGSTSLMT